MSRTVLCSDVIVCWCIRISKWLWSSCTVRLGMLQTHSELKSLPVNVANSYPAQSPSLRCSVAPSEPGLAYFKEKLWNCRHRRFDVGDSSTVCISCHNCNGVSHYPRRWSYESESFRKPYVATAGKRPERSSRLIGSRHRTSRRVREWMHVRCCFVLCNYAASASGDL